MKASSINFSNRNADGLIVGLEYKYNELGKIDWRSMIPPEFLVVQKEHEKEVVARYCKDIKNIDPREIDDKYLVILLGGLKYLLDLRGYNSVTNHVDYISEYKAVVTVSIEFIGNKDTGGRIITRPGTSSASMDSVSGVFRLFLESIAENRAFCRAVRQGLGINIVAKDEFDDRANKQYLKINPIDSPESAGSKPNNLLASRCRELSISFEKLKDRAVLIKSELKDDPSLWVGFESIQPLDSFVLISKVNEMAKKKK